MNSIGETLCRERMRRNLELGDIAGKLRISTRFLEAIESDRLDQLPGGVFAKSFVRQYAALLELDAEELSGRVQNLLAPPPQIVAQSTVSHPGEIQPGNIDAWNSFEPSSRSWP